MKCVFIVLFAVCALSVSAEKQLRSNDLDNFSGGFHNLIGESIQEASVAINDIIKEFNEIAPKVQSDIVKSIERTEPKPEDISKAARSILLDETDDQSQTAKECLEKYRPVVNEIIENAKAGLAVCRLNARNKFRDIKNKIQEQIDALRGQIDILREVFRKCRNNSRNPFDIYFCLAQQSQEIRAAISTIILNIKQASEISNQEIANILSAGSRCASENMANAKSQIDDVSNEIKNCIKENGDEGNTDQGNDLGNSDQGYSDEETSDYFLNEESLLLV